MTILETAEKIYNETGVSEVCEYANSLNKSYKFCVPCDAEMPIHQNICMVCGQSRFLDAKQQYMIDQINTVKGLNVDKTFKAYEAYCDSKGLRYLSKMNFNQWFKNVTYGLRLIDSIRLRLMVDNFIVDSCIAKCWQALPSERYASAVSARFKQWKSEDLVKIMLDS